ncbi:acetoacetate--CoA ligase [Rhodococcus sp. NCIMB 12038]|uniref:acetoacetate--CoA ligase n=1 Tax=Rhodococcus sp. NCIMB 12038 TaxID=933800 RepID=UPI000B580D20|nr:acetoacetate--CoA ligase [Rhodococcus sp. NCIMB 12038]OUS88670.1 acetoacetate--CoA ligase [Rhodococcus sp. NCIMB 12038]
MMNTPAAGDELRPAPTKTEWHDSRIGRYLLKIEERTEQHFDTYDDAWRWSITDLKSFWESICDEFGVIAHTPHSAVLKDPTMPGAQWFPGMTLNYAEHVLRELSARPDTAMVLSRSQTAGNVEWTGARLIAEIGRIQSGLARLGVGRGDRIVGYLPNIPEAVAAYLATSAMGAVWSSVPPEMGASAALQRISQLDPSLVISVDGYRWGDKTIRRESDLMEIRAALPDSTMVLLPYLDSDATIPDNFMSYSEFTAEDGPVTTEPVPFGHPLVVLFSSGTTGRPKAIVHCHGGFLVEHYKMLGLHQDFTADDIAFYYTTTGWVVWNLMVSSLLLGTAIVLVDGDPAWPALDGPWSQWAIAAETGATFLGTGAAYLTRWAHSGLRPADQWDLRNLRLIMSSGSALAADASGWIYTAVNNDLLLLSSSGGTDVGTGFVGGCPLVAVYAGEMSCRPLGVDVDALDPHGVPVQGVPGELVVRQPMPSMPVFFWGDEDFARYRASYFDIYPNQWRHGDWLIHTERDTWVITGRSDATLNRGGVRLGTAEFYAVLDSQPDITDSIILHFEDEAGMGELVLAVEVATTSTVEPEQLHREVRRALRTHLSPRHAPDHVVIVPSIPRNRTGKRLELPLKRIVKGESISDVLDVGVVVSPEHISETASLIRRALHGIPTTA